MGAGSVLLRCGLHSLLVLWLTVSTVLNPLSNGDFEGNSAVNVCVFFPCCCSPIIEQYCGKIRERPRIRSELGLAGAFLMGSGSLWCSARSLHFRSSPPDGGPSRRAGLWLALRRLSEGGAGPGPGPPLSQSSAGAGPPPRKPGALLPVRGSAHLRLPGGPAGALPSGVSWEVLQVCAGEPCLLLLDVSAPSSSVSPPVICTECGAGLREPRPRGVVSYRSLVLPAVQWIGSFLLIKTLEGPSHHISNGERRENDRVPAAPAVPVGRSISLGRRRCPPGARDSRGARPTRVPGDCSRRCPRSSVRPSLGCKQQRPQRGRRRGASWRAGPR